MPGTFSPLPRLSDPDMLHGTCVTHVPRCMPGSLISDFLWSCWRGKRSRHSRRMRNWQFYVSWYVPWHDVPIKQSWSIWIDRYWRTTNSKHKLCTLWDAWHFYLSITWWRHQIEQFTTLLTLGVENRPVNGYEFPAQRPVMRSFDVFFDLHLEKRLSKQSWGWWLDTSLVIALIMTSMQWKSVNNFSTIV